MAFIRRRSPSAADLIREANQVFHGFNPSNEYFTAVLVPFLGDLGGALAVDRFKSADDLEAIAEPLKTMPPVQATLCAGSVLHAVGKELLEMRLGGPLAQFIAAKGMSQALAAINEVDDKVTARRMSIAMDVLWRYEPEPYRGLDHAQVVYFTGVFALNTGEGHETAKQRWKEALRLLADVNPEASTTQAERDQIASDKRYLGQSWAQELAELLS